MTTSPTSRAIKDLRSFRRFELKFVVPEATASGFAASLADWVDIDPGAPSAYPVRSLYFDSPDLRCYWEKLDGLKFRRKVRIRRYGDRNASASATPVYLEIKQRVDRVTQKRRVPMTLSEAERLLRTGLPAVEHRTSEEQSLLDEVTALRQEYRLQPTLITGYRRTALIGTEESPGLRITFDRDLYYTRADLDLASGRAEGSMLPEGWVVIELKVNERLPTWLSGLIATNGLTLTRISKYVQGVERSNAAPPSAFHVSPGPDNNVTPTTQPRTDPRTEQSNA